jgi:hypothetical protein
MSGNYLAAESLLIAHLRQQAPEVRAVLSAADLSGVDESAQQTPALHVLYDGDAPGDEAGDGHSQEALQRWMVVIAVRELRGPGLERERAGQIIAQVLSALGERRPDALSGLRRIAGPGPLRTEGGYAYYPLLYTFPVVT